MSTVGPHVHLEHLGHVVPVDAHVGQVVPQHGLGLGEIQVGGQRGSRDEEESRRRYKEEETKRKFGV